MLAGYRGASSPFGPVRVFRSCTLTLLRARANNSTITHDHIVVNEVPVPESRDSCARVDILCTERTAGIRAGRNEDLTVGRRLGRDAWRQVGCEDRVRQPVMCRITGCGRGSTGRGPGACFRVSERGSTRDEVERRAACPATHALIVAARCSERACRARASSPSTAFGVRPSSALSSRVERPAKYLRRSTCS